MLRQFGPSTWAALLLGAVLAFFAFVPVVWWRYRTVGRLRIIDLIGLLLVASYAMALWTYTLIPIPETDTFRCARVNVVPFQFVADIAADHRSLLSNGAVLQAALNVVLFLPLGFVIRGLARRGVVWSTGVGLLISLSIELTQLTGAWGLYHCAYRVFDVDDLILNTLGAALGSVLAIPTLRMFRSGRSTPVMTTVTFGRRLTGMAVDAVAIWTVALLVSIGGRAAGFYLFQVPDDELSNLDNWLYLAPAAVQGYWVLGRGRTLGEEAVQLQPVARPGWWILNRIVKFVTGVGGYLLLTSALNPLWYLTPLFIVVSGLAAVGSRDHRGLSHTLAGMELRVGSPTLSEGPPPS